MAVVQAARFETLNANIDKLIESLGEINAELQKKQNDEFERLLAQAWEEEQRKYDELARKQSRDFAQKNKIEYLGNGKRRKRNRNDSCCTVRKYLQRIPNPVGCKTSHCRRRKQLSAAGLIYGSPWLFRDVEKPYTPISVRISE